MATARVSVSGIKAIKIEELGGAAEEARQAIFVLNPTVFTGIKPFTEISMGVIITSFTAKRIAFKQGGLAAKGAYDTSHTSLINCLISMGGYISDLAEGDEDILRLSTLPYTGSVNNSGALILAGALPTNVKGVPGTVGALSTTCDAFGKNVAFFSILTEGGTLPVGTTVNNDGQISLPSGETIPPYTLNLNGKRSKNYTGLTPHLDYYVYYIMSFGGNVSGLSLPFKISCGS